MALDKRKRAIARRYLRAGLVLAILIVPIALILILNTGKQHFVHLPIMGEKYVEHGDTVYHTLPKFSFVSSDGKPFTDDSLRGRIHVADFFFTTCPGICPSMSASMERLQLELKDDYPGLRFVSYSIDPENDSLSALREYAQRYNAIPGRWFFVRGPQDSVLTLAQRGYMLTAMKDPNGPERGFTHANQFVLVDKDLRVRGFYQAIKANGRFDELKRLKEEIQVLELEYQQKQQEQAQGANP